MSCRSSWQKVVLRGAVFVCCAVLQPAFAQEAPVQHRQQVQTYNTSITNNIRLNRLQRLEDDLTKFFKNFVGGDPMEARRPRPVPLRVIPASKDKKSTDWMNLDPSSSGKTDDSSSEYDKLFDDKRKGSFGKKANDELLEQLLKQDSAHRKSVTDRPSEDPLLGNARDLFNKKEKPNSPFDITATEEKLRSVLNGNDSLERSRSGIRPNSSSIFSPANEPARDLADYRRRENPYLTEYRNLMAPSPAVRAIPAGNDLMASVLAAPGQNPFQMNAPKPLDTLPVVKSGSDPFRPQFGSVNPAFSPSAPLDPTISTLNKWNPFFTPPSASAPAPARTATAQQPRVEATRRNF